MWLMCLTKVFTFTVRRFGVSVVGGINIGCVHVLLMIIMTADPPIDEGKFIFRFLSLGLGTVLPPEQSTES